MDYEWQKAQPGDLAQLVGLSHKNFIIRLTPGDRLQTHRGILYHDDLIGIPWGSEVSSHLGSSFFLLQPALSDLIKETKRTTQIIFPKDIGFILITMGIGPGSHVLEAGTGSGAMTTALAFAVGEQGHVTTYEVRPEMQQLAQKNLTRLGLQDRVTFILRDIGDGFQRARCRCPVYGYPPPGRLHPPGPNHAQTRWLFWVYRPNRQPNRTAAECAAKGRFCIRRNL